MTTNQAYENFIVKINASATTDNLSCDKGRFVLYYKRNEAKLIEYFLDKRFEDDIRYIQGLLVENKKLTSSNHHLNHSDFSLPKDYLDFSNLYVLASRGECKNKKIDCFEIKNENQNDFLRDSNNSPSFKYRETPITISSDKLQVYKDDFTVDSAFLSYYRYPKPISLVNPSDPESNFASNNPELDDKFINRVLDLCVADFFLSASDERFQVSKVNSIQKP